jgi:excisionase family DNA binding protein
MQKIETDWNRVPVIFDLAYAATLLGVSLDWLHKLAQRGQFQAFKVGKLWRVKKEDLMTYIENQKASA